MGDFSDFIPILIAIGIGLYQVFRFLFKGKENPEQPEKNSPPPVDTFGGGNKRGEMDWDDLLEALGQKEKPKNGPTPPPAPPVRIEPVQPKRASAPPPPPVREVYVPKYEPVQVPEPVPFYQPKLSPLPELAFDAFTPEPPVPRAPLPGLSTTLPSIHQPQRYRRILSDPERLRESIVLNEILNKPLSLR